MSGDRNLRILVEGRVQGVGFRAFVAREARARGVRGLVRNLSDGRVEAIIQGAPDSVAALCEACGRGPLGSRVARVDVTEHVDSTQRTGFIVADDA